MSYNTVSSLSNASTFRCGICKIDFPTKLGLAGHRAGKHRLNRYSICKEIFEGLGKLGRHKIEVHGYTPKQLGWAGKVGTKE